LLNWKDENVAKGLMSDWTHPNENGYRAIANLIGDAIIKLISENAIVV
jgi:lysophospholipase L1-like esterase